MAEENAGLTVEAAADKLAGMLEPKKTPGSEPAPGQESPTGDTAAPEAPSGDEQVQVEPDADEATAIEPPVSWDAEAKAKFASLPRDVQDLIRTREHSRDTELSRVQNEAAQQRKAIEAMQTQGTTQLQRMGAYLTTLTGALHQQLMGEFSDIKSRDDVSRLANDDPARYVRYQNKIDLIGQAQSAQRSLQQQQQQEQAAVRTKLMEESRGKLAELVPDLGGDTEQAGKNREALFGYLQKAGYTAEQLNGTADPIAFSIAWKAYKYDQAVAKQKAAQKAGATVPNVVLPGSPLTQGQANSDAAKAARAQLRKTGSLDDAAAVFARI